MAVAVNRVLLGGNLTRDPQVRVLANEQAVANFGLAIQIKHISLSEELPTTSSGR